MQINIENSEQCEKYFSSIRQIVEKQQLYATKYLDFGIKIIRVLCYTPEIALFLDQQLPFVLKDDVDHFDATIVFWKINDIKNLAHQLDDRFNPKINLRFRIDLLFSRQQYPDIMFFDQKFSSINPIIKLLMSENIVEAYDRNNHCCYYAVKNLEPEEFIKQGHLFVQQLNILLKSDSTNLTHGAVLGYSGQGVLLCARGQRGKSTLTVHSLLNGCEYVSDDYQLLEKKSGNLYAYPLYSIITLSPGMYCQMYIDFNGKFCCNNARKDKYVFNISKYHNQFKTLYPIKLCLFPEIVSDQEPSIVPCSIQEKGRAIVQFIHSTVMQMRDLNDHTTISKLFNMIFELPFYKFNLSPDISKNTQYLHKFLEGKPSLVLQQHKLPRFLLDITYDIANILDTQTNTFYSFNKFATRLYEMLLSGMSQKQIEQKLNFLKADFPVIMDEFEVFIQVLNQENLLSVQFDNYLGKDFLKLDFGKESEYKISLSKFEENITYDLIQKEKGKQ